MFGGSTSQEARRRSKVGADERASGRMRRGGQTGRGRRRRGERMARNEKHVVEEEGEWGGGGVMKEGWGWGKDGEE